MCGEFKRFEFISYWFTHTHYHTHPHLMIMCDISHTVSFELLPTGFGNPTSVDYVRTNLHQMVVSYSASKVMTFDLETGQSVLNFDSGSTYGEYLVHCVCVCD